MKYCRWDEEKNEKIQKERGISFEVVNYLIETQQVLGVYDHPNQKKYPGQRIYVIEFENYAYLVPSVEDETSIFLKTIIPSRKATRDFLRSDK